MFGERHPGRDKRFIALKREEIQMAVILVALLIVLLIGGLGFALHLLWWIALVALVLWLVGFFVRAGEGAAGRRRWYRW
jgi:lysylphosphatidylglycerol synthetase-like protein (DUF2156 family)